MYKGKHISAIIAAAGSGTRMGGDVPKQYMKIDGLPIIQKTVDVFAKNKYIDSICIVTNGNYITECGKIFSAYCPRRQGKAGFHLKWT